MLAQNGFKMAPDIKSDFFWGGGPPLPPFPSLSPRELRKNEIERLFWRMYFELPSEQRSLNCRAYVLIRERSSSGGAAPRTPLFFSLPP